MIGIGAANIAAGLFHGFSVSTSGSRTAVVEDAGARSQLASIVGAGLVAVMLVFLNSLLAPLPQSARCAHRSSAVTSQSRCSPPVLSSPQIGLGDFSRRHRRSGCLRCPAGHRDRHWAGRIVVLQAQLAATWRSFGKSRKSGRLAQHPGRPDGARGARHRGLPVGGSALLCQLLGVPDPSPPSGQVTERGGWWCNARR